MEIVWVFVFLRLRCIVRFLEEMDSGLRFYLRFRRFYFVMYIFFKRRFLKYIKIFVFFVVFMVIILI